jgi:anthranilate synthase component 1
MAVAVEPAALPVTPSLDEVRALARDHNLVPVRHTFIDDCETPVAAFLKLRGTEPQSPAFLLESAEQGQRVGRYSFIGVRPRAVLRWSLGDPGDPYEIAEPRGGPLPAGAAARSPPFSGGAVGYFGYDLVRTVEPLGDPNPDMLGLPDMALMLSDVLVVFDHLKHTITILVNVYAEDRGADVDASYAAARETIAQAKALLAGPLPAGATPTPARARPEFTSNMPREQFEAMVARIVEYVHAGDAFQVVPSQRWSADSTPTRSRSTGGCGSSTRARTCTSSTSATSRSPGASPEPLLTVSGPPRLDPPDRGHAARAAPTRPRTRRSPRACSPTRRSAPSTSCSSTSGATTSAACASTAPSRSTRSWPSRPTRT